jgi:hypothetical protein
MISLPRVAVAFLIAMTTVASGAATTTGTADAAPNACALVTTAEASTAMRVASLPGKARPTRKGSSCRYYSPDHRMNVFVQTVGADDMVGAGQLGGKPVAGVGDRAIWASGSLFIQKHGQYAQIGLYLSPASMEKMDPAIIPLGKTAASRM